METMYGMNLLKAKGYCLTGKNETAWKLTTPRSPIFLF